MFIQHFVLFSSYSSLISLSLNLNLSLRDFIYFLSLFSVYTSQSQSCILLACIFHTSNAVISTLIRSVFFRYTTTRSISTRAKCLKSSDYIDYSADVALVS